MLIEGDMIGGRYRVLREVGRGPMAAVYHAFDADDGAHREVALKVLWPNLRDNALVCARFRREIAIARRLRHPNIVEIHDLIDEPDVLCLVMEYVQGHDLTREMRVPAPLERVLHLGSQILDALEVAHTIGVVHRDLKPQNLLVDAQGHVRLSNFGLASVADMIGLTTHTTHLGTPEYMAPEQASSPFVDARADLYAVGAMLFTMLAGERAFTAFSPLEVLERAQQPPPSLTERLARVGRSDVPRHVCEAIETAMAPDPAARHPGAAAFRAALLGMRDGHAIARSFEPGTRTCRCCRAPLARGMVVCFECGAEPLVPPTSAGTMALVVEKQFRPWFPERADAGILEQLAHPLLRYLVSQKARPLTVEQRKALMVRLRHAGARFSADLDELTAQTPFVIVRHLAATDGDRLWRYLCQSRVLTVTNTSAEPVELQRVVLRTRGGVHPEPGESYRFPIVLDPGERVQFVIVDPWETAPWNLEQLAIIGVDLECDAPHAGAMHVELGPRLDVSIARYAELGPLGFTNSLTDELMWAMRSWDWRSRFIDRAWALVALPAIGIPSLVLLSGLLLPNAGMVAASLAAFAVYGALLYTGVHNIRRNRAPIARFSGDVPAQTLLAPAVNLLSTTESQRVRALMRDVLARGLDLHDRTWPDARTTRLVHEEVALLMDTALEAAASADLCERRVARLDLAALLGQARKLEARLQVLLSTGDEDDDMSLQQAALPDDLPDLPDLLAARDAVRDRLAQSEADHRELALCNARLLAVQSQLAELQSLDDDAHRAVEAAHARFASRMARLDEAAAAWEELEDPFATWEHAFEEVERDAARQRVDASALDFAVPARFELVRRLGSGGMATVYLARDRYAASGAGDELVALKVLHAQLRTDPLVRERLAREVEACRRIDHPGVVRMHELIEHDGVPILVMEYCPGGDLQRLIELEAPMPVARVRQIGQELLAALEAAHRQGVVHGDVKPHNVLVGAAEHGRPGRLALTDFGLARVDDLAAGATHSMQLGTPEYMAPEILHSPAVDGRADLYGVAVTLYVALTGKLPYRASGALALAHQHQNVGITPIAAHRANVPAALARVIERGLAREPVDRFATADQMLAALAETNPTEEPTDHEAAEAARRRLLCASCSAPMLAGLTLCLECGHRPLLVRRTGSGKAAVEIPVSRARGALAASLPGRRLGANLLSPEVVGELRERIDRLEGARPAPEFAERVACLPATVATGLRDDDARRLAEWLRAAGVDARVASSTAARVRDALLSRLAPSALALLPVMPLIFGLYFLVVVAEPWIVAQTPLTETTFLLICGLYAAVLGVQTARTVRPALQFEGRPARAGSGAPAALERRHGPRWEGAARETYRRLGSRRLRQMLRRFLELTTTVRERLQNRREPAEWLVLHLDELVEAALAMCARLDELESRVAAVPITDLYAELHHLDAELARSASTDDDATFIEARAAITRRLEERDRAFARITHLSGQMLHALAYLQELDARLAHDPDGELHHDEPRILFDFEALDARPADHASLHHERTSVFA